MHFTQLLLSMSATATLTLAAPDIRQPDGSCPGCPPAPQPGPGNCPSWQLIAYPQRGCTTGRSYPRDYIDKHHLAQAVDCINLDTLNYASSLVFNGNGFFEAQTYDSPDCRGTYSVVGRSDNTCRDYSHVQSFKVSAVGTPPWNCR